MKIFCTLMTMGVLTSGCDAAPMGPVPVLFEDETACYQFVKEHMLVGGGVITNFHEKNHNAELATGDEVLSESQGLLMNYAAAIGDRATFDAVYAFTKQNLDNGAIFAYRYNCDAGEEERYSVNAAVDDLRIIKALFAAGNMFADRALTEQAKAYADRFYKSNVENDRLYDFYDSQFYVKNSFITLCYLDLETLGTLANTDRRYQAVYDNSLDILEGGYISDAFPMFMTRYDYAVGGYEAPNGINMVEAVLSALNLSYADRCPDTTVAFLKSELEKGRVYAAYELDGTVKNEYESTAIYALCALLAREVGDEAMYQTSTEHMKKFMVTQSNHVLYGAFGDENNVYSFDNLMALTALRKRVE